MPTAFYSVPYERVVRQRRCTRRVAVDIATPHIHADGGEWSEMEVAGDRAVVRVRASAGTLKDLSGSWPVLKEVGSHLRSRHKPIGGLFREVADEQLHGERWRLAETLTRLADREGYVRLTGMPWAEAVKVLGLCSRLGYGLDRVSTGTFPTTSVLDSFDRANSADLGANWSLLGAYDNLQIVGNACTAGGNNQLSGEYWTPTTFGPDSEAFVTVTTKAGNSTNFDLMVRVTTPTGSWDGYAIEHSVASGTDTVGIYRVDNASYTQLGATINQEITNGDTYGLEAIGSTIAYYRKPAAGAWADISSGGRSDATYGTSGNIALFCDEDNFSLNDFGGGTVVGAAVGQPAVKRMGGVTFNAGPFGRLQGARGW